MTSDRFKGILYRVTKGNVTRRLIEIRNRRKGKSMKSDGQGWYHVELSGREYFTPFFASKVENLIAGPGDRVPTPQEIVDKLAEAGDQSYVSECGNYIINPRVKIKSGNDGPLPAGFYDYKSGGGGTPERLIPKEVRSDKFTKTSIYNKVVKYVEYFLEDEEKYRPNLYKTGILFFGEPGTGKTSCIRSIIKEQIPKDSVVIFLNDIPSNEFLKVMRLTLADKLKVFVFEEMITVAGDNKSIERVLDFLDGELSLDRSLYLATTNYPERLPANVVNRHGRFDELYEFGPLEGSDLKAVLLQYLGRESTKEEYDACKGLPSSSIQQACIRSMRKGANISDIIKDFKRRDDMSKRYFSKAKDIGIKNGGHASSFYDEEDDD